MSSPKFRVVGLALGLLITLLFVQHVEMAQNKFWFSSNMNQSTRKYGYAPSILIDSNRVVHMYYCGNSQDLYFKDSILYVSFDYNTRATISSPRVVFQSSGSGSWDGYHVCDPSVVMGSFNFQQQTFKYAMFYTGNFVDASAVNQIGVAFSNSLDSSSWVRYNYPIISHPEVNLQNPDLSLWGIGQPSAIAIPNTNKVVLTYTVGDRYGTRNEVRTVDFSNLDVSPTLSNFWTIPSSGLKSDGSVSLRENDIVLRNVDIAWDANEDAIYMVRDCKIMNPLVEKEPTYLTSSVEVSSMSRVSFFGGSGSFQHRGFINEQITSFRRNHNAGLARTQNGQLMRAPDGSIEVFYTNSCTFDASDPYQCTDFVRSRAEFSFQIYSYTI